MTAAAITYGTFWALYLLFVPIMARLRRRKKAVREIVDRLPSVIVIVPAANAAGVITRCVEAIGSCNYPLDLLDIYVVADQCLDNTAEQARAVGARVLVRNDGPRGKTYAIAWTLDELTRQGVCPDLYIIVDATALVQKSFLRAMAEKWRQGEDIISGHSVVSSENQTWYAQCLSLTLVHRNLQSLYREQLGLSALLEGRGMGYSQKYIRRFGWSLAVPRTQGTHPTEDWRHTVKIVEAGYRVAFAEDACVATPLRNSLYEATRQGARWERGRLINAASYAIRLLMRGVWQRNLIKIFAALDAIQPPAAILAALSVAIGTVTYLHDSDNHTLVLVGNLPMTLVGFYGILVALRGHLEGIALSTVFWGPLYMIWRCSAFLLGWVFLDRVRFGSRSARPPA
jgi:cellulose synthase/poly-beta-1,6-N-acetylglucosamine synthase-like glycosyltransferase